MSQASLNQPASAAETRGFSCSGQFLAWGVGIVVTLGLLLGWIDGPAEAHLQCLFVWLMLAPLAWGLGERGTRQRTVKILDAEQIARIPDRALTGWELVVIGLVALSAVAAVGWSQRNWPPAYHDEYSYVLQAQLFSRGEWVGARGPVQPDWFQQMHVLEVTGRTSRYYPGAAFCLVPGVLAGFPLGIWWLLHSGSSMLAASIAGRVAGRGAGWLAGLLCATAPALLIFHQLLLAHAPTLFFLLLFWRSWLWFEERGSYRAALLSGTGLSLAMLSRPATAAAVGLPIGLWLACQLARPTCEEHLRSGKRWSMLVGWGLPVGLGLVVMLFANAMATGSCWQSGYQLYTQLHTPRHAYGFQNVERAAHRTGPEVLLDYDRWAKNLTPELAAENVLIRLLASWTWSLDIVALAMLCVLCLAGWSVMSRCEQLLLLAIGCLHAVHIPYWYDGIMHFHYVFESVALWLILLAIWVTRLWRVWQVQHVPWMKWWLAVGLLVCEGGHWTSGGGSWSPRMQVALENIAFPRQRYLALRREVDRLRESDPAVVLVQSDPGNPHLDYVVNGPDWDAPVLFARWKPMDEPAGDRVIRFPGRRVFVFDQRSGVLKESIAQSQ